jgi:hypothetical protein
MAAGVEPDVRGFTSWPSGLACAATTDPWQSACQARTRFVGPYQRLGPSMSVGKSHLAARLGHQGGQGIPDRHISGAAEHGEPTDGIASYWAVSDSGSRMGARGRPQVWSEAATVPGWIPLTCRNVL